MLLIQTLLSTIIAYKGQKSVWKLETKLKGQKSLFFLTTILNKILILGLRKITLFPNNFAQCASPQFAWNAVTIDPPSLLRYGPNDITFLHCRLLFYSQDLFTFLMTLNFRPLRAPIAQNITARERDSPIYYIDMCVIRKWTIFSNYSTTHKHIGARLFPWPWIFLKIWSNCPKKSSYLPFSTYLSSFRYLKNLSI